MRFARIHIVPAVLVVLFACAGEPTAPRDAAPQLAAAGATHTQFEVSGYQSADFYLSCLDEVTHWEGPYHFVFDVTTTPSGNTITRLHAPYDPSFFVQRANGVRYYPRVPPSGGTLIQIKGPVTVIANTEVDLFESAAGDRLVLGLHYQLVVDREGNVVIEKFTGACP
jgi:hypothetical protein